MILAGILSGIEVALPLLDGLVPMPAGIFAAISGPDCCSDRSRRDGHRRASGSSSATPFASAFPSTVPCR